MLHVMMSVVAAWWCFPRFCQMCDRRASNQRLNNTSPTTLAITTRTARQENTLGGADFFDSLAMAIRSNVHPREALDILATQHAMPPEFINVLDSYPSSSLQEVLSRFQDVAENTEWSRVVSLLQQSYRDGFLNVVALDIASQTIRENQRRATRVLASTAQARITVRILTVLPLATLCLSVLLSPSVRSSLQTVTTLIVLLIGLFLNTVGYIWMRLMMRSIEESSRPRALEELLTSTTISVHAGDALTSAIQRWGGVNSLGQQVALRLHNGDSLSQALIPLEDECPHFGPVVRRLLIENLQAGSSLTDVVVRLKSDFEADSSRRTEILMHQLSTKLTVPVVLCILPAFLILALMPVAIASLGSLPSPSMS